MREGRLAPPDTNKKDRDAVEVSKMKGLWFHHLSNLRVEK